MVTLALDGRDLGTSARVGVVTDPLLADPDDRDAIATSVHDTMRRLAGGATWVYAVFLTVHVVLVARGSRPHQVMLLLDLICGGWAVFLTVAMRRRTYSIEASEAVGFVLVTLVALNDLASAWLLSDPHELFYTTFVILGLGAVTVRRLPWIALALPVALVTAGAAYFVSGHDTDMALWAGLILLPSIVLAAAMQLGRRSTYAALARLRHAERDRRRELETALRTLELELAERRRVEADRAGIAARERELADQLRHAQKLDALGTLAGGIAHDINNVLAAVAGVAELGVEDHPPGSPEREEFGHILAAAQRGASLTKNLLGFARRGKHRHEPVVLTRVIDEVLGLLGRTAPQRVRLASAYAPDATAATLMGDPGQLSQVVMNLCLNAIDAIPGEGTITVRVTRVALAERERATLLEGSYLRLEVQDTGGGMTAETLAHAFEPFYSTKSATTHRSGLGLAMVYGTVRDHLGEVSLHSELGRGTTATIYLPEVTDAVANVPTDASSPALVVPRLETDALAPIPQVDSPVPTPVPFEPASSGIGLPRVHVPEHSVLVIDDEPALRRVCRRLLGVNDIPTVEADGGAAGLAAFRASPSSFSMVLLDLAMPGMTGAECFRALRAIDPTVPIVLMSGFPKDQSIDELLAEGRAAFLSKPFPRSALVEALAQCRR